jgi:hypothetical protein
MLALQATIDLLEREYRGKLFRGEIGVSWKSGLESESTISAEKAYKQILDDLDADLEGLILIDRANANTSGVRAQ